MTEVRIRLPEEDAKRLEEEALRLHLSLEELVTARVIGTPTGTHGGSVSEEFRQRILQNIKEDEDLLRRLA